MAVNTMVLAWWRYLIYIRCVAILVFVKDWFDSLMWQYTAARNGDRCKKQGWWSGTAPSPSSLKTSHCSRIFSLHAQAPQWAMDFARVRNFCVHPRLHGMPVVRNLGLKREFTTPGFVLPSRVLQMALYCDLCLQYQVWIMNFIQWYSRSAQSTGVLGLSLYICFMSPLRPNVTAPFTHSAIKDYWLIPHWWWCGGLTKYAWITW